MRSSSFRNGALAGRPASEPRSSVSTRITAADHDRLIALAAAKGVTTAELCRAILRRAIAVPRTLPTSDRRRE